MSATPSRPDCLRESPYIDRTAIGMDWTENWRLQAADLFSGRGGVGQALSHGPVPLEPRMHVGYDHEDYSGTYPGQFVQIDLLDEDLTPKQMAEPLDNPLGHGYASYTVDRSKLNDDYGLPPLRGLSADVVWCSFPCQAYSSLSPTYYGSREAALEANPRITDELREFLLDLAPHYIIENVPRATKIGDLKANVRVNGLAFEPPSAPETEKFDVTRHFETTFECPDAYRAPRPDEEYITIDTRNDQSIKQLADAKGVPAEWGKQGVRSAIPWKYVYWVLHHCPSVPGPAPKRVQRLLAPSMANALGVDRSI